MEITDQPLSQFVLDVSDPTHAGAARRAVVRCAEQMGMGEKACGDVAIVVTEMATNVVKHARSGRILCERIAHNGTAGLRVLSIDKGPGIRDIATALEDGYSTAGTGGNGLGAVRRLSTLFDIYSLPGRGTCVLAEFWPQNRLPPSDSLVNVGVISVPLKGEPICGDGWKVKTTPDRVWLMVVDGLGHGTFAADAAHEANRVLAVTDSGSPALILRDCHDALRKTRGAAAAIAAIAKDHGNLLFAGLGNISAVIANRQGTRGLASHNGTVGHQLNRIQEFTMPWTDESILIMHTDGLATRWDLNDYPGIWGKHPSLLAAVLYRDFARERDDVTVLVAKNF